MKKIIFRVFVILMLYGCGGGNPGTCNSSAAYCAEYAPTSTNVNTGVTSPIAAQVTTQCGVAVGPKLLEGLVTAVHDGDTITLNASGLIYKIRLDSIDAPELAQPFGSASQQTLETAVFGKTVKVAYSKTDQYDRIVGAVFTDSCKYVNLDQVASGMAWFYKAYQCEISASVRSQFALAQANADSAKLGLWSQTDPEAPWFYRNGVEPVTPICTSDSPSWAASSALTSVGSTTTANSSSVISTPTGTSTVNTSCYTGPRGGTYTITANGNKNYSGC